MKILVIEDEHKIANSIKKGLELESFIVDTAYDGETGIDLASDSIYDAIVLDLMLPKLSGTQVCTQLRKNDNHTPILILTAKGELEDKVEGLNIGADDYLVKPFAFAELVARLKALLRRPINTFTTSLEVANLKLNPQTYEVTRDNQVINLSRKEFSLLEYLMRHSGQILSKEQITNSVWNYDSNILPNTIEVYIGYLRNKIDKPFPKLKPLIHTIRGFGYKLGE